MPKLAVLYLAIVPSKKKKAAWRQPSESINCDIFSDRPYCTAGNFKTPLLRLTAFVPPIVPLRLTELPTDTLALLPFFDVLFKLFFWMAMTNSLRMSVWFSRNAHIDKHAICQNEGSRTLLKTINLLPKNRDDRHGARR
jgi:hypothetical protein